MNSHPFPSADQPEPDRPRPDRPAPDRPERPDPGRPDPDRPDPLRNPQWSPPDWTLPGTPPDPHAPDPNAPGPNPPGRPGAGFGGSLVIGSYQPFDPSSGLNPRGQMFSRLLGERIVMLGSELNDESAAEVTGALLLLAAESRKDIWLYVNSSGGSVPAAMAVLDTMDYVECDVATVAMGVAASMGQLLLSAGARGKRYALPHARVMMHEPSGGMTGSATDVRIAAEQVQAVKRQLAELNARNTGQPVEQIEADSERDRWFTAAEALDYGLVDQVMSQTELRAVT
jgi:ATP-dependent Clp protease protease subunit